MVKPLLKYPDPTIRLISGNVRFFNDELKQWIADMVDTMKAHDLDALSAILIGIQYSIIVIKEADAYLPYINACLIKHSGKSTQTERSLYYEGISVDVERYEKVTVVYEDEEGMSHSRDLEGDAARTFQHHLDYCYGSTFVDRVNREMKQRIDDYLEFGLVQGGSSCPRVYVRDYFKRGVRYLMGMIALTVPVSFFVSQSAGEWVYRADLCALIAAAVLLIGYFIYAQIEARRYKQCTSCQTGNIIGTTVILFVQLSLVAGTVFLWVAP